MFRTDHSTGQKKPLFWASWGKLGVWDFEIRGHSPPPTQCACTVKPGVGESWGRGKWERKRKGICLPLPGFSLKFWAMEIQAERRVDSWIWFLGSGQRNRESILQAQLTLNSNKGGERMKPREFPASSSCLNLFGKRILRACKLDVPFESSLKK